jgi:hypothetical protein
MYLDIASKEESSIRIVGNTRPPSLARNSPE